MSFRWIIYIILLLIWVKIIQYIFDHFLNRYVDVNRNQTYKRTYQYHYDPRNEKLMLIDELPWIKMDEKKSTE